MLRYPSVGRRWWEEMNPEADWEALYQAHPNVDWAHFYGQMPEKVLGKGQAEIDRGRRQNV